SVASYVSTLDLFNIALTNRANHTSILGSPDFFRDVLRRDCLCDGYGLRDRQNFSGQHALTEENGSSFTRWDEPIEVRLYNLKCDEADALPCRVCSFNVCEECRDSPRLNRHDEQPSRRPHLANDGATYMTGFSPPCDTKMEDEVRGKFLHELCDCDIFHRWVFQKCACEERVAATAYFEEHTSKIPAYTYKALGDKNTNTQKIRRYEDIFYIYSPCGANVPKKSRLRCSFCKRQHLPRHQWH
ncbi:hypothetical protein B0H63DRAFT_387828, partial [Podospora didyma]